MQIKHWKTLSSRLVYQNPWIRVREDIAEMPNGKTTLYGVVECGGAVGVLPFVDEEHVLLVRQYRYVFNESERWEMPTGGIHPGEALDAAARRELQEEVGFDARVLERINTHYTNKSIMQEHAHLYIGRDLVQTQAMPDDTEFFEVKAFPFIEVVQMVLDSEIRESMTVMAVLLAERMQRNK